MCDLITPLVSALGPIGIGGAAATGAGAASLAAGVAPVMSLGTIATAAGTAAAAVPTLTAGQILTAGIAGGALSFDRVLSTAGTIAAVGGPLVQGAATRRAAEAQAGRIQDQRNEQAYLSAIEADRTRLAYRREIATQQAQLAAAGIDLGSPSAIYLGQSAAREMAFATDAVRQNASAADRELSYSQQSVLSRGRLSAMNGRFTAAGSLLTRAPALWPELMA